MKIIIVGMGMTGTLLADAASREHHDVTVIDSSASTLDTVTDLYSVSGVCGSGASRSILMKAGADTADILIALTPADEINLMCCLVAKGCGARYTAAKIHRPEFADDRQYISEQFHIDYIINPKRDTATEISRQIGLPCKMKADGFFNTDAAVVSLRIEDSSRLRDMSMKDIKRLFDTDMLVGAINRDGKLLIPKGDTVLLPGDTASIIVPQASIGKIAMTLGLMRKPVKRVLIVGGGVTGFYLTRQLLAEKKSVTIIESSRARCLSLSEQLPEADICYSDGTDSEALLKDGLRSADVCVSLTGSDETNLVTSMFAWSCGLSSIITKINQPPYEKLLSQVSIDITVSPSVISVDRLLSFIRNVAVYNEKGNDIKRVFQIAGGLAEATEFIAYDSCEKNGVPFQSSGFKLKSGVIIAAIIRDHSVIIPNGSSSIACGDHVIVIARPNSRLNTLNDIFS